jgi:hypothetical protein
MCAHFAIGWLLSFCEEMATSSSTSPAASASTLPSSSFMNWFWDLASDDHTKRLYAGTMIIKHIVSSSTSSSAPESLSSDGEYALKRLIRGVSSSRDSARQGFSSCLCQLYVAFPLIEMNKIISLIEDSTKVCLSSLSIYLHSVSIF